MHDANACELQHHDSYHNRDMLHPTIVKVTKCHNRSALLEYLISFVESYYSPIHCAIHNTVMLAQCPMLLPSSLIWHAVHRPGGVLKNHPLGNKVHNFSEKVYLF